MLGSGRLFFQGLHRTIPANILLTPGELAIRAKLPKVPLTICMGARGSDRGPRPSVGRSGNGSATRYRGSRAPGGQIPGTGGDWRGDPASLAAARPALPCPLLGLPCPLSTLPCPALPGPASEPKTRFGRPAFALRPSNPDRVREANCLLGTLACFSSSGRHRPRGPTTRQQSISILVAVKHTFSASWEGKQRARNPPLRGVWGVSPKP